MINIGGLAIGMAVSFMLLLYVYNEFSFDKFNKNSDIKVTIKLERKQLNTFIAKHTPNTFIHRITTKSVQKITKTINDYKPKHKTQTI